MNGSVSPTVLDPWAAACVDAGRFAGGAWLVSEGSRVLAAGAAGDADRRPPPRAAVFDTPFDLASLTKPLCTALLAVLLETRGTWSLETAVADWLPGLRGGVYADTSLLALGQHRSGLPAWHPLFAEASDLAGYVGRIGLLPSSGAGETVYSDPGFILLGAALEQAAGAPLDVLFEREIARPLGLSHTGFAGRIDTGAAAATERGNVYEQRLAAAAGLDCRLREAMIQGEVHDANAHHLGGVAGHAGLFGTASEVGRLAAELLVPVRLDLPPAALRRLWQTTEGARGRPFGFEPAAVSSAACGVLPDDAPGHTGFTGTSLWLEPARGRVYVLLTNRVHPRVSPEDFQPVRREFHRRACAL